MAAGLPDGGFSFVQFFQPLTPVAPRTRALASNGFS